MNWGERIMWTVIYLIGALIALAGMANLYYQAFR